MMFRRLCIGAALLAAPPTFAAHAPAAPAPAASAPAATRPVTKTRIASRVLVIQPNDSPQPEADFYIALRERIRQRLAAEHVAADDQQIDQWWDYEWRSPSGGFGGDTQTSIVVKLPETVPPIAAAIADDLVEFTRSTIIATHEQSRTASLARVDKRVDIAEATAQAANRELKELRQKLRDLSGRSDVSPKTLMSALANMDDELQRLQLESLSKESRQKALEEQIAALTERVQKRIESDPIAAEFQKVVEAREERIKTTKQMYESGTASREEMSQAVAQAAEAKAKLLQQQRDSSAAAGGTALEAFNRELMTLSIDSRELEAKTKYLQERLPRLREAVELLDDYNRIQQRAADANSALDEALREQRNVRDSNREDRTPRVLLKESRNEQEQ